MATTDVSEVLIKVPFFFIIIYFAVNTNRNNTSLTHTLELFPVNKHRVRNAIWTYLSNTVEDSQC